MSDFIKKPFNKNNNIISFTIDDKETKKVTEFYKTTPFPNYKSDDNKQTILDKCANSYKDQIHSFGLCDNQDFMNQIQNYENNSETQGTYCLKVHFQIHSKKQLFP